MSMSKAERRVVDGAIWRDFCDNLKEAGDIILRKETPASPFDRAEGFRYLTRLLRAALDQQLEFGDPRFPGFYQLANETVKIGNDNPDNCYLNATISGRYDYRITGTRGTVHYISFGTKAGGYEQSGGMAPTGQIDLSDMHIEPDGSFELIVSCKEQPGNWLPMQPDTTGLIVRQTFLDREKEEVARMKIERIDPDGSSALDPETLEQKLGNAVAFVKGTANLFVDWMTGYESHLNQLPPDDQEKCQAAGGDASIYYFQSYWKLEDGEALVVRAPLIPECESWNFQISNYWMESLDYRYHRIHINKHSAVYEDDGSVTIVLANENPGPKYPNALETAGHNQGGMLFRWISAKTHPPVEARVVKFSDL